jgi:hypothetical protein
MFFCTFKPTPDESKSPSVTSEMQTEKDVLIEKLQRELAAWPSNNIVNSPGYAMPLSEDTEVQWSRDRRNGEPMRSSVPALDASGAQELYRRSDDVKEYSGDKTMACDDGSLHSDRVSMRASHLFETDRTGINPLSTPKQSVAGSAGDRVTSTLSQRLRSLTESAADFAASLPLSGRRDKFDENDPHATIDSMVPGNFLGDGKFYKDSPRGE